MNRGDPKLPVDWDHVYLLGWYGEDGRACLTTWDGDLPMIDVVVLGIRAYRVPAWDAEVPRGATVVGIPDGVESPTDHARELGGIHAFGWHVAEPIKRKHR